MDIKRVYVLDTTLRDGEQSPGCSMNPAEKLKMAAKLVDLGVDALEAGFPISSQGDFEAVETICEEFPSTPIAALARATPSDIECAARALESCEKPRILIGLSTSDVHLRHKMRKSREEILALAAESVELARRYAEVEFGAEDSTRSDQTYLEQVCSVAIEAGAAIVTVCDTVGYAVPAEFQRMVAGVVRAANGAAIVSTHCHNDLGLALANSIAGLEAGARQVHCTVNGIGERAGNCALEEFVMLLKTRRDHYGRETAVRSQRLYAASETLAAILGVEIPMNKAIVGGNAFAHEAGIHQDGYLKHSANYQIVDPRSVGAPEVRLVLGKHSGRHALSKRCEALGHPLTRPDLDELYQRFLVLADRKKHVSDEDLTELLSAQRVLAVGEAVY